VGHGLHTDQDRRKAAAWVKAIIIPGRDPSFERWDCDFWIIRWAEYGSLSEFGWEIDHIVATIIGGSDALDNLRARHWRNNRSAGAHLRNVLTGV
jgi:hypothetical protein